MHERPRITTENCPILAAECCEYYADISETYERPRGDPVWQRMRNVAETWRRILVCEAASEADIEHLQELIEPLWVGEVCATTWICMATAIDLWLRSIGRPGMGPNPWYGDRPPDDVRPFGIAKHNDESV